jgi:hypothetical protein
LSAAYSVTASSPFPLAPSLPSPPHEMSVISTSAPYPQMMRAHSTISQRQVTPRFIFHLRVLLNENSFQTELETVLILNITCRTYCACTRGKYLVAAQRDEMSSRSFQTSGFSSVPYLFSRFPGKRAAGNLVDWFYF